MAFGVPLKFTTAEFPLQIEAVAVIATSGKGIMVSFTAVLGVPIQFVVVL